MSIHRCLICSNESENQTYEICEMMMGTREKFEYFQCSECGCLQISCIPKNIQDYYPTTYYSFETERPYSSLKKFRYKHRLASFQGQNDWVGKILSFWSTNVPDYFDWVKRAKVDFPSKILDVGCGGGNFLSKLAQMGFTNLTGIDPFISK